MKTAKTASVLLAAALASGPAMQADTLVFRNGNRIDGSLVSVDAGTLRFGVGNHVNTYNRAEVDSIVLSGGNADYSGSNGGNAHYPGTNRPAAPPAPPTPPVPPAPNSPAYAQAPPAPPVAPVPPRPDAGRAYLQVPAGTQIVVRLIDRVDSESDRLGQSYRASVDQPIEVDGQTLIPRGADATATLVSARNSGKIEGRTVLTLDLKSVQVNGQPYDIVTTGVSEESNSRGAKSAKVIGGTAAVGAIIGAIAGGGRGAAIGAGSGAAAGTAAQVMTSGQRVTVPAETRLAFTLQNPINVR